MSETKFNRDAYAHGASVQSMKAMDQDAQRHNKKFYEDQNRVGFHEIQEGLNIFRIATAHDPKDSPYMPVRASRLDVEVDEYDQQGNKTGNKTWRKRKCYIATQHGPRDSRGNALIMNDVIEYYIEFLTKRLKDEGLSDKEKEKRLAPVHGYWSQGKYQWGIRPESKYICYAWDQTNELRQLELSKPWYAEMETLILEASANTKVAIDIFSHIDAGIPLIIEKIVHKEQGKKNKTEYKVRKDGPDMNRRESWDDFFERTRVTDKQLKDLLEKKSLKEMYRENYTMLDFERAVIGLRRFDETWKNGLFQNNDFLKGVSMIEAKLKKLLSEDREVNEKQDLSVDEMYTYVVNYVGQLYDGHYSVPVLNKHETILLYQLAETGAEIPKKSLIPNQGAAKEALPPDDLPFDYPDPKDE